MSENKLKEAIDKAKEAGIEDNVIENRLRNLDKTIDILIGKLAETNNQREVLAKQPRRTRRTKECRDYKTYLEQSKKQLEGQITAFTDIRNQY